MLTFKHYLLNEEKAYLGHRIGDVLTVVHDLEGDIPGLGTRQISRIGEEIVNQIRKILHGQWSPREAKNLKDLQKIGVALMKAIDEKGDLKEIVPAIASQLEEITGKMGMKNNDIQLPQQGDEDPSGQNGQDMDMQLTAMGPTQPQVPQQAPPQQMPMAQISPASLPPPQ